MSEGLTFPQSPSDGETISFSFQHTGGDANNAVTTKTWSWDGRYNAWISNSGGVVGSDRFVLKAGDTMSGNLTTTKAFRTSGDGFSPNEFVTKSFVEAELAGFNPSGNYVLKTGDTMSGTLTGTTASFSNSITAPSGFIGTLTANKAFRNSEDGYTSQEFITKKFFTDNEYRTGTIKHFNLYLTYQAGDDDEDTYEAWDTGSPGIPASGRYAKSIHSEIGPGVTGYYTINGFSYKSEYHDLTEEKVGFPKPWAVKVKKSFWRSSRNAGENVSFPGPRYYPPHGPRSAAALQSSPPGGPGLYVCDSQNFTTEKDIRIRYIGFQSVYSRGGPGPNAPSGTTSDIVTYMYEPLIGVDFPADGASDGGFARIKLSTFTIGGYEVLGGDIFINEIDIVPG